MVNDIPDTFLRTRCQDQIIDEFGAEKVDGILPYFTYSDSSQVTLGGHEFHPVVLYLACGSVEESRKETSYRRIALLYKVTADKLGLGNSRADQSR